MKDSPARIGLTLAPTHQLRLEDVVGLVQHAESLGYESVWIPETWGADAVTLLTVLARETGKIGIASGVLNVYSRSAMLIAQTAASLQEISGGRFVLGLGASGPIVVENWHGVAYGKPVARTREYVEAIRLSLGGKRVDYEGESVRLSGFKLLNPPAQAIPLYVASIGPRNVEMTGELADGWLPIFAARGHMEPLFGALRRGAEVAGRPVASIDVGAFIPGVVGPRAELLLRQQIAYYVGGMGTFYAGMLRRIGFEQDVAAIRKAWEAGDRATAVRAVSEDLLSLCTVSGDDGKSALHSYRSDGIGLPIIALPHGTTAEEALATVDSMAGG